MTIPDIRGGRALKNYSAPEVLSTPRTSPAQRFGLARRIRKCLCLQNLRCVSRAGFAFGAAFLAAGLSMSCRDVARAFGPTATEAESHAEQFFAAFAARFARVERSPKYEAARGRLANAALLPSRIFDDTTVWTSSVGATRTLLVGGATVDGHYRLDARASVPRPPAVGDERHIVALRHAGSDEYVWDTRVDLGVGAITASDVGGAMTALLGAPDGRNERDLRADYRSTFPRAAAAMGRLFSVDSLQAIPASDATTATLVVIGIHADALREWFPNFGRYLGKYVDPARIHLTLADPSGAIWVDIASRDRRVVVRLRSYRGRLIPLTGAPRPLPDTLQLITDYSMKVKMWTMGVRRLVSDFVITEAEHERAWTISFRREPEWELPLGSQHLIRRSLRHPFEGGGALLRLAVRDSAGVQTLLTRQTHLAVQESSILRIINGVGSHAVNDLNTSSEREEDAFLREVFVALQEDVRALGAKRQNAANP